MKQIKNTERNKKCIEKQSKQQSDLSEIEPSYEM
jgi:hypothetical protein